MKFTKITRLISNEYDRSHIKLEGEIEENETFEDADFILRTRLSSMITDEGQRRILCAETDSLNRRKNELVSDCAKLAELIRKRRELLENNGIIVDEFLQSDIPF